MSFIEELKRRHVFRVAIAYLAFSWLMIEVAGTLFPGFGIPDWAFRFVVILLALGFIPTLVLSWAYEITPDGLKRDKDVVREGPGANVAARRLDWITIVLVIAAFAFVAIDRLWLQGEPAATASSERPDEVADPAAPERNSIAVLPFANRSANPDDVYFVDGIHDDLLTFIARIGTIKTISRTSVMQYRDSTKPIPQIAEELDVRAVLEGGVQRAGDQVRINVQLIDAATDDHIWSRIYDRELTATNIFAIQSEIAGEIAEALRATLTPEARQRIDIVPTENLAALEAYFLGKQAMALRQTSSLEEALEKFEEAVALDPNFALAWVNVADTVWLLTSSYDGSLTREEALPIVTGSVEKALELDPMLGEAHVALGNLRRWERDYEAAETAYERGIALNPNYSPAYHWYGEMLSHHPGMPGRMSDALELTRKAVDLDPRSAIANYVRGNVLRHAGRSEESLAYFEDAHEFEPQIFSGPLTLYNRIAEVFIYDLGRLDKAVPPLRKLADLLPDNWEIATGLAWVYLSLGDMEQVAHWHERTLNLAPDGFVPDIEYEWHLYHGDHEAALERVRTQLTTNPTPRWTVEVFGNLLLQAGQLEEARRILADTHPELLGDDPEFNDDNLALTPVVAHMLRRSGEAGQAERLVNRAFEFIGTRPHVGPSGIEIADARLFAALGDGKAALEALEQAVAEGWRSGWWYYLDHDPVLESLHDESQYLAIRETIAADMAEQRARLREQP